MAKVKISELPFCASPLATGLIPFSQCGVTYATNICSVGTPSVMVAGAGTCSILGNGCGNTASGVYSVATGGLFNEASGCNSFVGGGRCNTASGYRSFVGGGQCNIALCCYTGVFGCNLCNTQPCTFMANNFVVGSFVGCNGCSLALDINGKM